MKAKKIEDLLPNTVAQLESLGVCYQFLIEKAEDRIQIKLDEIEKLSKFLGLVPASVAARKSISKSPPKKLKKGAKSISAEKRALSINIDLNINPKLLKWGIEIPMMKKLIDLAISI